MDNELMRFSSRDEVAPYRDRGVSRRAKRTYDDVRLKALQADGAMALSAHIMEGLVGLDDTRRGLANGDPIISSLLMEIEAESIRQVRSIQRGLNDTWGL